MTKKQVCNNALKYLPKSGLIGVGAGSTVSMFLDCIKDHDLTMVCANDEIKSKAMKLGFRVIDSVPGMINLSFDGADYFDSKKRLIKGYGLALLREKVIDYNSKKVIILAEKQKKVSTLSGLPIPVEVHPIAVDVVPKHLRKLGAKKIKLIDGFTDNGNRILHCTFSRISKSLEQRINVIPGVLENGLFIKSNVKIITD